MLRITAICFTIGFTLLDALLCKGYFYPLIKKAEKGELYSPPPKYLARLDSKLGILIASDSCCFLFSLNSFGLNINVDSS